jgi:protein-tyrosine phosphatase
MGGHGRTGTALASVLMASGKATDPDTAIELVRSKHCKRAIETYDQIDYLEIVAMILCKWKASGTDGHCASKPAK